MDSNVRQYTGPKTSRQIAPGKVTPVRVVVGVGALIAIFVIAAILFAPEKPPVPPTSSISYTAPPEAKQNDRPGRSVFEQRHDSAPRQTPPAEETSPSRFVIYGTVTEVKTGTPVAIAILHGRRQFSEDEQRQWREARDRTQSADELEVLSRQMDALRAQRHIPTDHEGRYALRLPAAGIYRVWVHADGYLPVESQDVEVSEANPEVRHDFVMSKGASISGRVVESRSRAPAPDVEVYATAADSSRHLSARTDGQGYYAITGVPQGEFRIALNLRASPYQVLGRMPEQRVRVDSADQEVTGVDFEVEAAGIVWGYVLDPAGKPIQGIEVVLCSPASVVSQAVDAFLKQAPPISDNSDDEGYYELIGAPLNQEWKVFAFVEEDEGWAPQLSAPFLLTDRQRYVRVDLFLTRGTTVHGRVVTADGKPVPNADVLCVPWYAKFVSPLESPLAFKESRSDDSGAFVIADLPSGEYQIFGQKDGYKIRTVGERIYPDGVSDIRGVEVVLTPVESGTHTVFGTVTDTEGRPIPDVHLSLVGMGGESLSAEGRDTRSGPQGQYEFTGVEPGFLMLIAEKEGYPTKTVGRVLLDEPTNVAMEATAVVTGRVLVRETNEAPPNYRVSAMPVYDSVGASPGLLHMIQGIEGQGFSSRDGSFSLNLAGGSYTLEARASGYTPGRVSVTVEPGRRVDGVTIYVLRSGGRIEGRVRTADGQSPRGALVWIGEYGQSVTTLFAMAAQAEGQPRGVQVGADGLFEFDQLPEGAYNVYAQTKGYAQGQSGAIYVAEGQTTSGVSIVLGFGGALSGYVSIGGQLKPGAVVSVVGNGLTRTATTDRNGQYLMQDLAPGSYLASAISLDSGPAALFSPLHARVEIQEGRTTIHNFGEETGGAIEGQCTPPPGSGSMGFAVLHLPGAPDLSGLNFSRPQSWFQGDSTAGNYVVGMSQIGRDGYFKMDQVPEGTFILEVVYVTIGELLMGGRYMSRSMAVTMSGRQTLTVNINMAE